MSRRISIAAWSALVSLPLISGLALADDFALPVEQATDRPVTSLAGTEVFQEDSPWVRSEGREESDPFAEHIETDRDSFTPATTVVGRHRSVIEMSYSFIANRTSADTHSFPELLTRVGLTERTEFRIGWNYEVGGGGNVSGTDSGGDESRASATSEAQVLFGFKTIVSEQREWLPESAVILQGYTPTAGPEDNTDMMVAYVVGWTLPDDWKLDTALRYATEKAEGDSFNQWAPSVVLRVPVHERWNVHAEYFGIFTQNKSDNQNPQYISPGVHYLITPDCEIGIRTGWGLSDDSAHFFSNIGLGLRF